MARSTLADIIALTRTYADAATNEYTRGAAVYWSDDHLQDILDRHRSDVWDVAIAPVEEKAAGGSVVYKTYYLPGKQWEATDGGTAVFQVLDANGANIGTANYTADYNRGVVTFAASQGGSVYYLRGRNFDVYGAAAEVWRAKASYYATAVNFSTDNHRVDRGALVDNMLAMAARYDLMSNSAETVIMTRSDTPGASWA
jgi:hypothetical protein